MDSSTHTVHTANDLDRLISEKEAAEFVGFTVRALQNWRLRGGGPVFVKLSARAVRYQKRDLIAWAKAHIQTSTSNAAT